MSKGSKFKINRALLVCYVTCSYSLCTTTLDARWKYCCKRKRLKKEEASMDAKTLNLLKFEFDDDDSTTSSSSSSSSLSSESDLQFLNNDEGTKAIIKRRRIENYVEVVVPAYSIDDFFSHFRMSRGLVDILESSIATASVLPTHNQGREKVTAKKATLLTIWYLANQEGFRQIADRFNLSLSTCHVVIGKVTGHFVSTADQYIKWPDRERQHVISTNFKKKQGIEGITGAIDGSHIKIKRPVEHEEVYMNRKGYHSVLIQGTCDHKRIFMDIYCGEPGSQHDARMFRKSPLYRKAIEEDFFGNNFLLGDSAYPSLHWLVPPFKDNGNLTDQHRSFNFKHSSTRMVIEHAFGLLKGRFRRLHGFENQSIRFINKCIVTACVFHNLCIRNGEEDVEEFNEEITHDEEEEEIVRIGRREMVFNNMFM